MSARTSTILLWLFVINLGIAFGAGVYEHRIVVPHWITSDGAMLHWNAEAARSDNTGLKFWAYVTTGPLTLLTLANLFAARKAEGPARGWWLAAALVVLADRILTFSYFIPTMVGLMNAADSPASVAIANRWSTLNYLRHGLVLSGWLAALKAFSLRARHGAISVSSSATSRAASGSTSPRRPSRYTSSTSWRSSAQAIGRRPLPLRSAAASFSCSAGL